MKYCALASGSNGNSYYIAKNEDAVLIDIGINCKQIELRMANLQLNPHSVKGIFITHEHTDHIRGVSVFARRYRTPMYMTKGTFHSSNLNVPLELVHIIDEKEQVEIGQLTVSAFPKLHDAAEPCSFTVSDGKNNVAIITDIGTICDHVIHAVKNTEVLILESNYDDDMLMQSNYPYFLKERIAGNLGHLSNKSSLELFVNHRSHRLKHVILSHLSGQNNTVEKALANFAPYCKDIELTIATRDKETKLYQIFTPRDTIKSQIISIPNKSAI